MGQKARRLTNVVKLLFLVFPNKDINSQIALNYHRNLREILKYPKTGRAQFQSEVLLS